MSEIKRIEMDLYRKLEILADAAKYDASCASSGTEQRDSSDGKGLGSTAPGMGICHSYAPDGRCISLLKVLLTTTPATTIASIASTAPPRTCRAPASPSTRW
jgi:predicted DNA-binding helix-hairpin-helix protein